MQSRHGTGATPTVAPVRCSTPVIDAGGATSSITTATEEGSSSIIDTRYSRTWLLTSPATAGMLAPHSVTRCSSSPTASPSELMRTPLGTRSGSTPPGWPPAIACTPATSIAAAAA